MTATRPAPPPAAGVARVEKAEVAYQRDELATAAEEVEAGVALCRDFPFVEFVSRGLATQAWIRQAQGDPDGARRAMEEAESLSDPTVADLLNPVPAQRARLLLAQDDIAAAAEWVAEGGLSGDDEPSYVREPAYLLLVRVLLAQERPKPALRLLDRLRTSAIAQRRTGNVIEITALCALGLSAVGDERAALSALAESLTLAAPRGYIRVFADEGDPMHALIGRLIAGRSDEQHPVPVEFLGRLVQSFSRGNAEHQAVHAEGYATGLLTGLSEREVDVLVLLARGKQNQEIADELFVALSTVK